MTRTIKDIMATQLVTFTPDTNIHQAIHTLLDKRISGAPVIDDEGTLREKLDIIDQGKLNSYIYDKTTPFTYEKETTAHSKRFHLALGWSTKPSLLACKAYPTIAFSNLLLAPGKYYVSPVLDTTSRFQWLWQLDSRKLRDSQRVSNERSFLERYRG